MRKIRIFLYIALIMTFGIMATLPVQGQPQNPPGTGPPGDPGGGRNPHNRVPFSGLELLVLAGGILGFRKIRQLKDNR